MTLWGLDEVVLVTSAFAIAEADRNLDDAAARTRLYRLLHRVEIADEPRSDAALPTTVALPPKDAPILLAAIDAKCTHLLTGDRRHFGPYFGRTVRGVRILTVRDYLVARGDA